jgi:hypothetical protein
MNGTFLATSEVSPADNGPSVADRRSRWSGNRAGLPCIWLVALLLITFMAGCSSSSSPSPEPLTDAQWIGFKDGDGNWQKIEPESFTIDFEGMVNDSDGRYSLAIVQANAEHRRVRILTLETTLAELNRIDLQDFAAEDQALVEVMASSVPDGIYPKFYLGFEESSSGTFSVNAGTYDLIGTYSDDSSLKYPTQYVRKNGITVAVGQNPPVEIDFALADALTEQYAITIPSTVQLNSGEVFLLTANGTAASLGYNYSDGDSLEYSAMPLGAGDLYMLELYVDLDENSGISYFKGFDDEADDYSVNLPPGFDGEFAEDRSSEIFLPGMTAAAYDDRSGTVLGYTVQYVGKSAVKDIEYGAICHVSAGQVGLDSPIAFFMPDLHSAPGWNSNWSIPTDVTNKSANASVQVASDLTALQVFVDWFIANAPRVAAAGQWFASLANYQTFDGVDDNL